MFLLTGFNNDDNTGEEDPTIEDFANKEDPSREDFDEILVREENTVRNDLAENLTEETNKGT
ncbi:unnamed protein product [Arabidopsis thaliana]|uniref:Uncharacterized protein n=1 Tax=Arabidopsis thaliana TaxID=3702 RepID=A0A5S9WJ58_ARATH|nr:unnamed protein product [Arabidopsis thaliana]